MSGALNVLMGDEKHGTSGAGSVSVSITGTAIGYVYSFGTALTGKVTANVLSGGTAPFTYAWTCTGSPVPTASTMASTAFSETFSTFGTDSQTATVTVTDVNGNTGTATVAVNMYCVLSINLGSIGFL